MKIISTAAAVISTATSIATSTATNPFEHKTSPNTPHASYMNSIMAKARPTPNSQLRRQLDGANNDYQNIDISSYSIKYEKCQYIKQYAAERNEDIDSVLETKHFVIFKLCPNNACGYEECTSNYGEYIIDMETYLETTLKHKEMEQEYYCEACNECGAEGDDDAAAGGRKLFNNNRKLSVSFDCNTCYNRCQNIENMEENGYVDASQYLNCEKIYENENTGKVYYAGPVCSHSGGRIKVGLFTDASCTLFDSNASPDKYLKNEDGYNLKLSYHLLKQTFVADECVASCAADNYDDNGDDDANNGGEVELAEVCQDLYQGAGKCETPNGMTNGMDYSNSEYYELQQSNEETVCEFLSSISSGHWDTSGEVVIVGGRQYHNEVKTSGGQKFALTFFVLGTVGLVIYAAMLHKKITRNKRRIVLDSPTGVYMA